MSANEMNWFTATPLRRILGAAVIVTGAALLLSTTGCNMSINKDEAGGKKNVEINTPFGDFKVKNQAEAKDTGLPVYPGATAKREQDDDKNGNGSVSLSLFGLKVVVASYVTDDPQDKVLSWYRDQIKPTRFIECSGTGDSGNFTINGKKNGDEDGPVTCEKENQHNGAKVTELKMGTQRNQKIVAVRDRKDGKPGTEFALVRVIVGKGGSV